MIQKATEMIDIQRPILKTITYRILGSITSLGIAYLTTGSFSVGVIVGSADLIIKPIIYFFHELIWEKNKNK